MPKQTALILISYVLLGGLHEAAHLLMAHRLGALNTADEWNLATIMLALLRALFGRQVSIADASLSDDTAAWIRHAGWLFSCGFAAALHLTFRCLDAHKTLKSPGGLGSILVWTAYATALEALATDLFQFTPTDSTSLFFCGNFGLIILNPLWLKSPQSALDILQDMIRVTMMRGAQAGGVVTFQPTTGAGAKAIRTRVVNRKRTDLSEGIIKAVRKDNRKNFQNHATRSTMVFAGHTRFATSSIADFGGTHPHRWSPRAMRWVHNFETPNPNLVGVENYIMHNGDFEFYELNGTTYDLETVQDFLEGVLCEPMPSTTDSCAIAGMVDLLRTQGCFSLSTRYALALGMPSCNMATNSTLDLPNSFDGYQKFGAVFEIALEQHIAKHTSSSNPPAKVLAVTAKDKFMREELVQLVLPLLQAEYETLVRPLVPFHIQAEMPDESVEIEPIQGKKKKLEFDEETGADSKNSLSRFARTTIDAFFDNDLLQTTKEFLANAHGSFGLCITSSMDSSKQMCLAARGQTISIGFYPKSGLVLYGSEQAAVKAAMNVAPPEADKETTSHAQHKGIDDPLDRFAARLDLDDLGGEICLIDWDTTAAKEHFVSPPNRNLPVHTIMNKTLRVVLCQQTSTGQPSTKGNSLFHRMTLLEGNEFIQSLAKEPDDLVLSDIQSIPRVCLKIQEDWQNGGEGISFNRLTALALSRSLIRRLDAISTGNLQRSPGSIDILLTGCEVSLWLAEQMASDLKKAFTKLNVMAVSSNKVLGLFGQEQSIPAVGFPLSRQTHVLTDSIVIIVSHSGGTFGPLQCSNLLQSVTRNIFAVTGEWDCQIGKQLRSMHDADETQTLPFFPDSSRLFTTGVGLAPAEPCSLSVAATQQLLTLVFEHMCIVGISNPRRRHISGAVITQRDIQILERCNRDNIQALEAIVGVDCNGKPFSSDALKVTVNELRAIGDRWAEHVLENAKAYAMSFVYIVVTVTTGWPLISTIGHAFGAESYEWLVYCLRFLDSLLYFWLPQVCITILRLVQGRDLLHRMVGRTVVIGDIPWVAQSSEAFLSKIFACSYSIAGLTVHSGNPVDHLVHRHTHRVVRGTLFVCGRPDGRLMSLTSAESAVLLSVNQASSIQSFGGRCESVTIGHNPFENPLCYKDIFLERFRPLFLCERVLDMTASPPPLIPQESASSLSKFTSMRGSLKSLRSDTDLDTMSSGSFSARRSGTGESSRGQSSSALMGRYSTLQNEFKRNRAQQRAKDKRRETTHFFERIMANATERDDIVNCSRHGRHKTFFDSSKHGRGGLLFDSSKHGRGGLLFRENSSRDMSGSFRERHQRRGSHGSTAPEVPGVLPSHANDTQVADVLAELQLEQTEVSVARRVFEEYDADDDGLLGKLEFLAAYKFIDASLTPSEAIHLFEEADLEDSGQLSFDEFLRVLTTPQLKLQAAKNRTIRDHVGLVSIQPSEGKFFDDDIYRKDIVGVSKIALAKSESLSMELYEARIASLQRFVSMTVMFHQLGSRVQSFFSNISFGFWGYRVDRTHSILRVATTASPSSGAHVRKQMEVLRVFHVLIRAVNVIAGAWARYKARKIQRLLMMEDSAWSASQGDASSSQSAATQSQETLMIPEVSVVAVTKPE